MIKKVIVLAAGGTAGHINAALALGEKFQDENFEVLYFTGQRHLDYKLFQQGLSSGTTVRHLDSHPLKYKNPLKILWSLIKNIQVLVNVLLILLNKRPQAALGAGGYVCGPVLLAAFLIRVPVFIIEQNAVLGLTNKLLSLISKKIFVHFKDTIGISESSSGMVIVSGNPIRREIRDRFLTAQSCVEPSSSHSKKDVTDKSDKKVLRILIFGGSLGAKSINDLGIDFVRSLTLDGCLKTLNGPLFIEIRHQLGKDYKNNTSHFAVEREFYQQYEYLDKMSEEYLWCDLVLCRSGASTISELRIVERPAIIIPFPHHKDRHQFHNAESFAKEVTFPVYIENCESLRKDKFLKLNEIIFHSYCYKEKKEKRIERKPIRPYPEEIIYQEIKKYV